ncbi:MAG TPA: DUF4335 domain-containing protein [Nodosilinea sp.]|nr:DUF4335 domain-containing protein [Nodosilinea sp.]
MAAIASVTSYEYAAGTCTLRLVGELSPLSQVTGRPVLGRSRFYLQVHDSDAAQGADPGPAIIFEASGREPQFSVLSELVQTYVQRHLSAQALAAAGTVSRRENSLQLVGLTRHRLTLAVPPEPPKTVELSTLQLSDLADALDQADSNLQILPDAALPKARRVRPRLPLWLGSVAAVGIAALLGNQFLTTAPSPVVLSPSEPPSGSTVQSPSSDRQLTLEEAAPSAASEANAGEPAPAAGAALPAPVTTAPTGPAMPPSPAAGGRAPKLSTQPPTTAPATAPSPPETGASRPSSPPQAGARGESQGEPSTDTALQQAQPAPSSDATRSAPASPEAFESAPSIAATSAPDSTLDWLTALTRALEQQWRPPANLAAPLRYNLTLAPNGTVTALTPLNYFSETYQNTPTLPQPDTTLPGVIRDDAITVEVQFLPSGEVVVVPPGEVKP